MSTDKSYEKLPDSDRSTKLLVDYRNQLINKLLLIASCSDDDFTKVHIAGIFKSVLNKSQSLCKFKELARKTFFSEDFLQKLINLLNSSINSFIFREFADVLILTIQNYPYVFYSESCGSENSKYSSTFIRQVIDSLEGFGIMVGNVR